MFSFHAMGTEVTVTAPTLPESEEADLAARVVELFREHEHRFSRFAEGSELSQLNRADQAMQVSAELFAALTRARAYLELTDGLFDPAILVNLSSLGYDRSFAPQRLDREKPARAPQRASLREVQLDPDTRRVFRPPHVKLDLGGMIKGFSVDQAMQLFSHTGAVDAGGDAALRGPGAQEAGWWVDVEDPYDASRTLLTLRVRDRAVATSSANRRRWRLGRGEAHHLIDPRTGQSCESDLAQVTVLAPSAELADVLAKTAFLLGSKAAGGLFERVPGVSAVLATTEGSLLSWGALEVSHD